MTIAAVLLIMAAIVVVAIVIGALLGAGLDDRSHALGAVAGLIIGSQLAIATGVILVAAHFISKLW